MPERARWVVGLIAACGAVSALASVSAWAMARPVHSALPQPNPATQRQEMIRTLQSIDRRLAEVHKALEQVVERLPADKE